MLTDFGKCLRKIRIDCGEIIKDMAEKLGVTASYLSAVETGKRNVPETWVNEIAELYGLDNDERANLIKAANNSTKTIKLDIENLLGVKKETAILFAREFENADDTIVAQIRDLLKKDTKGE